MDFEHFQVNELPLADVEGGNVPFIDVDSQSSIGNLHQRGALSDMSVLYSVNNRIRIFESNDVSQRFGRKTLDLVLFCIR